jgi:hypothetical protein
MHVSGLSLLVSIYGVCRVCVYVGCACLCGGCVGVCVCGVCWYVRVYGGCTYERFVGVCMCVGGVYVGLLVYACV